MKETVCAQLVEQVTDYLEGTLSPDDLKSLADHLVDCDSCENYINQVRTTIRLSAALPQESLRVEVDKTVLQLFRAQHSPYPEHEPRPDRHDDRAGDGAG
jgi:anti-sigma factor RsiW